ncbi:hypothetical protein [Clostridium sp. CF012]|uniref:hypothetical protein n=1 Tax=Clostridium sp. CF012 TaxID=2843319 RepID=UPI001C0D8585|nr:hypothetical protein [Clostridium sp. CF012]MBU3144603.1 hypothetical protein [Clostridium sp. CF012]
MHDFENLIKQGKDIISTHALFKSIKPDFIEWIYINGYTLILDEVMNVIDTVQVSRHDYDALINQGIMEMESNGRIVWSENYMDYEGEFNDLKHHASNHNLYQHSRSSNGANQSLVWTFPVSIFKVYSNILV